MSDDKFSVKAKYCGNCGQKLLEGATFCAYCGNKAPSTASPVPQPPSSTVSMPGYQPPYQLKKIQYEPARPFFQHFQGVLLSPQEEMPQIAKRPNLGQPFIIVILAGLIAGIAIFSYLTKMDIQFSETLTDPFGLIELGEYDMEELTHLLVFFIPLFSPIGFLFEWFIHGIILWILLAIFSSKIPSYERSFKINLTISGWAFLPAIFNEIIRLIVYLVFVKPTTLVIESIYDLSVISTPSETIGLFNFFADIFFLLWGVVLVYFALKSIDPDGSHAIIMSIIYAVIIFFLG